MAPTTRENTPRSKSRALASGTAPIERQLGIGEVRCQEGAGEQPSGGAGPAREKKADAHPAHGQDPQARLDPVRSARHVLQDERDRHGDARDEPASGQVVTPQKQEHGGHADHRKQQRHDQRGHGHGILDGVALLAVRVAVVIDVLGALLLGNRDALGSRAEPPQQGVDGQRDDAEHRDLSEGVEAAEVDQDDVHDVGAAALDVGVLHEEARDAVGRRPGHRRIGERRQSCARAGRDQQDPERDAIGACSPSAPGPELLDPFGKPPQAEQKQHRGHGLHDELRQSEIGRRQPDEADAGDEARAAEQDQRREAMKLGLIGGAERTGDPDRPDQREGEVEIAAGKRPMARPRA